MRRKQLVFILSLLLPGVILFFIFALYPVFDASISSFFHWSRFDRLGFAGLSNYSTIFAHDLAFFNKANTLSFKFPMGALPQNLLWMLVHVPISLFLGLFLAMLLKDLKGSRIIKSIIFLGMVTPLVVAGILFLFLYDPDAGVFNAFLRAVGLGGVARNWLFDPGTAIFALIMGGIWVQTGFSLILYSAALVAIPEGLLDAAKVDGASAWQRFRHVIWPNVKPVTMVVLIMSLVWVLRVFDIVYAVSPTGGPGGIYTVMGLEVYRKAFTVPIHFGLAMAIAFIELIIAIPLAIYIVRMGRRE